MPSAFSDWRVVVSGEELRRTVLRGLFCAARSFQFLSDFIEITVTVQHKLL